MQDTIENFFTVDNLNIIMPTLLVICAFGLKIFRKYPPDPIGSVKNLYYIAQIHCPQICLYKQ